MLFTLHIQNHINNVFQHLGASDVPRLGHMAYQENGDVMLLGNVQQRCRTLPHLKHHDEEESYKLQPANKTYHFCDNNACDSTSNKDGRYGASSHQCSADYETDGNF